MWQATLAGWNAGQKDRPAAAAAALAAYQRASASGLPGVT